MATKVPNNLVDDIPSTQVTYNNAGSTLSATEVESALDELDTEKANLSGAAFTGPITTTSTVDGRDLSVDGDKLDGIEANATADQTKADIDALGINADFLDGQHGSFFQDASNLNAGTVALARLPASVTAGTSASVATNGWWKDENTGIIVQWGITGAITASTSNWTDSPTAFPTAFPNNVFIVNGAITNDGTTGDPIGPDPGLACREKAGSLATFQYFTDSLGSSARIAFIAIGN